MLKVEDICQILDVKPSWVYDEVAAKRLRPTRAGRLLRFQPEMLQAWIDAHTAP
jgi:excisionase family DNA binding protein